MPRRGVWLALVAVLFVNIHVYAYGSIFLLLLLFLNFQ